MKTSDDPSLLPLLVFFDCRPDVPATQAGRKTLNNRLTMRDVMSATRLNQWIASGSAYETGRAESRRRWEMLEQGGMAWLLAMPPLPHHKALAMGHALAQPLIEALVSVAPRLTWTPHLRVDRTEGLVTLEGRLVDAVAQPAGCDPYNPRLFADSDDFEAALQVLERAFSQARWAHQPLTLHTPGLKPVGHGHPLGHPKDLRQFVDDRWSAAWDAVYRAQTALNLEDSLGSGTARGAKPRL